MSLRSGVHASGDATIGIRSSKMLRSYLEAAMRRARYEQLEGNEGIYGEIPGFDGLWASAQTSEACTEELASALEEWVVSGLQLGHELPSDISFFHQLRGGRS
jgi:predicted RNase H-like HicB family nuclease